MIRATSIAQQRALASGALPSPERIGDGLGVVAVPVPSGGSVPYTLCYVVEDAGGALHLVDPGVDSAENWELLVAGLRALGHDVQRVASVVATHLHADHLGMAARVRAASGAAVLLHERDEDALRTLADPAAAGRTVAEQLAAWQVPAELRPALAASAAGAGAAQPVVADLLLHGGELLDVAGRELRVLPLPGHTPGSIGLLDEDAGPVWTGDQLLPEQFPGIGFAFPADANPLVEYLGTLRTLSDLGDPEVLPGHGYRFRGLRERVGETARHQLRRTAEVAAAIAAEPEQSVWQLAARLSWSAGWENLRGVLLVSALRQTAMHLDLVRSGRHTAALTAWGMRSG